MWFLLLFILLFASDANAQIPAALGWYQIPNTNLRSLCPSPVTYPMIQGGEGCTAVTSNWSGGALDTKRDRLLIFGGGHDAYAGNEIYALNLTTNPIGFSLVSLPSTQVRDTTPSCGGDGTYSDGTPGSRHSYGHLAYLPDQDAMLMFGGGPYPCNGFIYDTWWADVSKADNAAPTTVWTRKLANFGGGPSGDGFNYSFAYDKTNHLVYAWDGGQLWSYDPALAPSSSWTTRSADQRIASGYQNAVIDAYNHRYYVILNTGTTIFWYDITNGSGTITRQSGTITDANGSAGCAAAFMAGDRLAVAYDPVQKLLVGWHGGNNIYEVNPATLVCTTISYPGGPSVLTAGLDNGTYGRFQYVPDLNVFVFCGDIDSNCYSLRLTSDFAGRCVAAGVVKCVGFDQASDIAGTVGDNYGVTCNPACPQLDQNQKASGSSSLYFNIPAGAAVNTVGPYFTNFSDNLSVHFPASGADFYVQWRQRFSSNALGTNIAYGMKQVNTTSGDQSGCNSKSWSSPPCFGSCTEIEVVTQEYEAGGFPIVYNSCPSYGSNLFEEPYGANDFKLQNAMPSPYCLYSQKNTNYFPPTGNCFAYTADQWMTFQLHIHIGTPSGNYWIGSHVDLWAANEGAASVQLLNYNVDLLMGADNQEYGKVWLQPYTTDTFHSGQDTQVWYDELIISTQKIRDPGLPGGGAPATSSFVVTRRRIN